PSFSFSFPLRPVRWSIFAVSSAASALMLIAAKIAASIKSFFIANANVDRPLTLSEAMLLLIARNTSRTNLASRAPRRRLLVPPPRRGGQIGHFVGFLFLLCGRQKNRTGQTADYGN